MSDEQPAQFQLFITGFTQRSELAIRNCHELLEQVYGDYELRIFDTLDNPDQASAERLVATPTLIRIFPSPRLRLVGDLSDRAGAIEWLRSGVMARASLGTAEEELQLQEATRPGGHDGYALAEDKMKSRPEIDEDLE